MVSRLDNTISTPKGCCRVGMLAVALFLLPGITSNLFAQELHAGWRAEPQVYLAGITTVWKAHGVSHEDHSFVTAAEIRFHADTRPWTASLFAEYTFSGSDRFNDILNLGGFIKHRLGKWDTATYVFVAKQPDYSDNWIYAGRLRYRLAENHKVGVQAAGRFGTSVSPALAIGYYGSISESLSLNVIADPGINGAVDVAARMELVWQVR